MRQAGVIAAAGIVALEKGVENLRNDHRNAKTIAKVLSKTASGLEIDVAAVETNMVYATIKAEAMGRSGRRRRLSGETERERHPH